MSPNKKIKSYRVAKRGLLMKANHKKHSTKKRKKGSARRVIRFPRKGLNIAFKHSGGAYYLGDSLELLASDQFDALRGKVQLILTSPPYPLNEKKAYGNLTGKTYLKWFVELAPLFSELLTPDGSIVIEIGNAWENKRPVQSLLHLEALIGFAKHKDAGLRLIQQFVCYNPSRLPSPAQWVTVNRKRVVDSYTHVWWFSKTDTPKADNSNVVRPYSASMKRLLKTKNYNAGLRPSHHRIGKKSFLRNNEGSIAHNFFELEALDTTRVVRLPNAFAFSNTGSNDHFHRECQRAEITPHPARMPVGLASFFIQFLTEKNDLVLDPFSGSNTTGYAAALNNRKWLAIEIISEYADQALLRFKDPALNKP